MTVVVDPVAATLLGRPICPIHDRPMRAAAISDLDAGLTRLAWLCPRGCVTAAIPLLEEWAGPLGLGRRVRPRV